MSDPPWWTHNGEPPTLFRLRTRHLAGGEQLFLFRGRLDHVAGGRGFIFWRRRYVLLLGSYTFRQFLHFRGWLGSFFYSCVNGFHLDRLFEMVNAGICILKDVVLVTCVYKLYMCIIILVLRCAPLGGTVKQ